MKEFKVLIQNLKQEKNILGLILVGSRGKGFENDLSDYDLIVIVEKKFTDKYLNEFNQIPNFDFDFMSLSKFQSYAEWKSETAWDRYNFTHCKILFDKIGNLSQLVQEKGSIPIQMQKNFIEGVLDGYINNVYRSLKCWRNKNQSGAILEASQSIQFLLDALFALEVRPKPFNSYLEKELKKYPLSKLPFNRKLFLEKLLEIIKSGNWKVQQDMFFKVEFIFKQEEFSHIFNAWDNNLEWIKTVKL